MIGNGWVKLKAWTRIGVLVNQLRRLLDASVRLPSLPNYTGRYPVPSQSPLPLSLFLLPFSLLRLITC
jgi:hypothetical protein